MSSKIYSKLIIKFILFVSSNSILFSQSIVVYFNKSVNVNLANPLENKSKVTDLAKLVTNIIDSAKTTIDIAMYSLNMNNVTDALKKAKLRGVVVRVISHIDNFTSTGNNFQKLIQNGINVISNPKIDSGIQPLMHNKFCVIDNSMVVTGSWNATYNGTYLEANNLVIVNDKLVSETFTTEFNEMWGSENQLPDLQKSKFGSSKTDNTNHNFKLFDGTEIEVYFSPSDKLTSKIVRQIDLSKNCIYTSNLTMTSNEISNALKRNKENNKSDIRCLIDNTSDQGSVYNFLQTFCDALAWGNDSILLHHKYAITDVIPFQSTKNSSVSTGSFNFTYSAESRNDENLIVIHNSLIANQFLQEFSNRYKEANGLRDFNSITSVENDIFEDIKLYQNSYSNIIWIENLSQYEFNYELYSNIGNFLISNSIEPNNLLSKIDLITFPKGVYWLKTIIQGKLIFKKILILNQ